MELGVGSIVEGKVTGITKFGAFVALPDGKSGLVHISEIAYSYVNEVSDFLSVGQQVKEKYQLMEAYNMTLEATAAKLMGVNTEMVITVAFFSGTLCAAIAGLLIAMYYGSVDTTMYLGVSMKTFAASLLGGIGSLPGAALGGVIIGVLEAFVAGYVGAEWKDCMAFVVLILVLLFRPSGLFGYKEIKKV